jgi:hypothetical protein
MLSITAGQASPVIAALVYCTVIASCHEVYALDRAREWTSALSAWCDAQPELVAFRGICLVHRAEIARLSGEWPRAAEQAARASSGMPGHQNPEAHHGLKRALAEARTPLARAKLLPAAVEVLLLAAERDDALARCHELEQLAGELATEALAALAA